MLMLQDALAPPALGDIFDLFSILQRHAGNFGYTKSREVVGIDLSNSKASVQLSIPKAYLTYRPSWNGGRFDFVTLEAALPDLNPGILDPRESVPAEDRVLIQLQASVPGGTSQFVRDSLASLQETGRDDEFLWYHERYLVDSSGKLHMGLDDNEYAVPLEQEKDPRVLFNCLPPAPDRKVGCIAYTELPVNDTASVDLQYQIRRSELRRWREIDQAVRKLILSFANETRVQ
jgi:hypothetical protein